MEYVLKKLKQDIFSDETKPKLAKKLYDFYSNSKKAAAGEGDYLKKELAEVDRQIENIVDAIADGTAVVRGDDPLVVKQVIERFVKKAIIKTDTIEVNLMVSVHTTGGGGGS
ncbi:hypothetical protein [Desulforamulus hydrothermalis]|uniref:Uncharacterized protein n=1 Tax=Desulforamulus hydrothermalis Lam5 = DSM 18033 TaxID=1121428 RepID=K8E7R8_9FIRM|nr:hypothetical protein [Desulforamulus hydrothermalis]CCO07558.1 hypothetical protein DESHY_110504 [Desulforamulus hydrothermalis Lam5 = DSM 18033]